MQREDLETLRRSALFRELSAQAFDDLTQDAQIVEYDAHSVLFQEGDPAGCFYFLLEGECVVSKRRVSGDGDELVARIHKGELLGELSMFEAVPRSATVRVVTPARLAFFSSEHVQRVLLSPLQTYPYVPFLQQLEKMWRVRIHQMNAQMVALLASEADRLRQQKDQISLVLVYLVSLLCVFMFFLQWLKPWIAKLPGTTMVTAPLIMVMVAVLVRPIRALELPLVAYGITTQRWRESLRDGLLFALPVLALATLVKWGLNTWHAPSQHLPLFDCFSTLTQKLGSYERAVVHFAVYNVLYFFLVAPLQELLSRGLLQGLFERLLESKRATVLAILLSNLVFGAFHLYLSVTAALFTVGLGIYLGWMYTRTRNLLGPWLAHSLIGAWILTVVRFPFT